MSLKNKKLRYILPLGIFIFFTVILAGLYIYNHEINLEDFKEKHFLEMEHLLHDIVPAYDYSAVVVMTYSELDVAKTYLEKEDPYLQVVLENAFVNTAVFNKIYSQIRLLDAEGNEKIRINMDEDGTIERVGQADLQNKMDRYYVQGARDHPELDFYVSLLDLNVENGVIEVPYKPTLRIARAIKAEDEILGYVVFNICGAKMFDRMADFEKAADGKLMLINQEGYYLYHEDEDKTFTFQLDDSEKIGLFTDHPGLWQSLQTGGRYFKNQEGYHFVTELRLYDEYEVSDDNTLYYAILDIPKANFMDSNIGLYNSIIFSVLIFYPLFIYGGWILGRQIEANREYRGQLLDQATRDEMTGLYNRRAIYQRIRELMALSDRKQMAFHVLFVDVNDLKQVNDTKGHEMGDQMLISVGEALEASVRSSDLTARLGGDEFLVVLLAVETTGIEKVISRINHKVADAGLEYMGEEWTVSCGYTAYQEGDSLDDVIQRADKNMYEAKRLFKQSRKS